MKSKKFSRDLIPTRPSQEKGMTIKPRLTKSIVPRKRNPLTSLVTKTEKLIKTIERKNEGT